MMKQMARGGDAGMPGMPGMPGHGRRQARQGASQQPKKGKGRSASRATPPRPPSRRPPRRSSGRGRPPTPSATPTAPSVDYEKAAAAAQPAQGLLQVPEVTCASWSSTPPTSSAPCPDGWWKDRAGAARRLHERLLVADTPYDEIVLVLEGQAKGGVRAGRDAHVRTVHAPKDGDAEIEPRSRGPGRRPGSSS